MQMRWPLSLLVLMAGIPNGDSFAFPQPRTSTTSTQRIGTQNLIHNQQNGFLADLTTSKSCFKPTTDTATRRHSSTTLSALSIPIDRAVAMASLGATAKLLSSIGLGSWAAKSNILDANSISVLSRLVYWIFQPAFLLTSVCKTLHSAANGGGLSAPLLALMPLTALIQIGLGNIVGRVVTQGVNIDDPGERRDVIMCTTFANSGPLPLIFSDALFATASRGAVGAAIQSDVAACISFYLLMWSPLFWSYGKVILGTASLNDKNQKKNLKEQVEAQLKLFFSPPVTGAVLGLLIGSIAPIRKAFLGGVLSPIFGALGTLGTAYLPAAMLVLAGSLVGKKDPPKESSTPEATTKPVTGTSFKAILAIVLARFCFAPLLAFGVVQTLSKWQLVGPLGSRARSIIIFTLLMEGCMPPAQNSVILLQLEGLRDRATRMAKILTIIYSVAVLPVTILLSACLGLSGILKFV